MAYRQFNIPLTAAYQDLYSLILAQPGAVPVDGVFPDRVVALNVLPGSANTTDVIAADSNNANTTGYVLVNKSVNRMEKGICLRDHFFKGNGQSIIVETY